MLAGATLAEAFYAAHRAHPTNEFVEAAIEDGYMDAVVLYKEAVADVAVYIKTEHNEYHIGQTTTHIEKYEHSVLVVEPAWKAHCDLNAITVSACPRKGPFSYHVQYATFEKDKFKHLFPEWDPFDNAKTFWHKLQGLGIDG
eukprot:9399919-Pyramimonas_sp.AAC.1